MPPLNIYILLLDTGLAYEQISDDSGSLKIIIIIDYTSGSNNIPILVAWQWKSHKIRYLNVTFRDSAMGFGIPIGIRGGARISIGRTFQVKFSLII
jgi:hypothetical protein